MTGTSRIPRAPADLPAPLPSETQSTRAALRKELSQRRAAIAAELKTRHDAAIGARLLAWQAQQRHPALGVYWPLRGEVDLSDAYARLAADGVRLLLPVVLARDAPLGFAEWVPGEAMHKDAMGIAVPLDLRMAGRPPALLVPCLGFDDALFRLGYGGGFYDRTLAQAPRPATVGIAYACQHARFDSMPHDIPLDLILTENGIFAP
ncbi:MAG: 5-formyltetrahydrofolate cyclo-ligase [Massilia sp.]